MSPAHQSRDRQAAVKVRRLAAALLLAALPAAAEWPQFRGPGGQGAAAVESAPLHWSENRNVAWKTNIPGLGWSSPVLRDRTVWLTTSTDSGRSLRAVAVDADSGRLIHNVEVFRLAAPPSIHNKNSHASPTPILEAGRVYVHFGRSGTAALDADGNVLWRNQEHTFNHVHGSGGSPVLWRDLLIFTADGADRQSVVALDKNTGKTRWAQPRRGRMAFATPLVFEHDGRTQILAPGGDLAVSYDPASGEELWRVRFDGFSTVPRPVYGSGLVYFATGFYTPQILAVRPDGSGDVTDSRVEWRYSRGAPLTPSPLLVGDELYIVSDRGIASCLDARTGKPHWQARVGGAASASPVYAAGRVYFTDENGLTVVFEAGPTRKELARNQLDGRILASPAIEEGVFYLRTDQALYRIEERP